MLLLAALVLVLRFLADFGYMNARDVLSAESGVSLSEFDAADNVDLLLIMQVRQNVPRVAMLQGVGGYIFSACTTTPRALFP